MLRLGQFTGLTTQLSNEIIKKGWLSNQPFHACINSPDLSAVQAGPAAAGFTAVGVAAEKLLAGGQVAVIEAT